MITRHNKTWSGIQCGIQTKHGRECGQNAEVVRAESISGNQMSKTQEIEKKELNKIEDWVREIFTMLICKKTNTC